MIHKGRVLDQFMWILLASPPGPAALQFLIEHLPVKNTEPILLSNVFYTDDVRHFSARRLRWKASLWGRDETEHHGVALEVSVFGSGENNFLNPILRQSLTEYLQRSVPRGRNM